MYSIPSAKVKASSSLESAPASCMWYPEILIELNYKGKGESIDLAFYQLMIILHQPQTTALLRHRGTNQFVDISAKIGPIIFSLFIGFRTKDILME